MGCDENDEPPSFGETIEDIGEGEEIVEYPLGGIPEYYFDLPLREKIIAFLEVYGKRNPEIEAHKKEVRETRFYSRENTGRYAHIGGLDISHVLMSDFDVVYVGKGEEEYYYSEFDGGEAGENVRTNKPGEWEQLFKQLWLPFEPQKDFFLRQGKNYVEPIKEGEEDIPF